MFLAVAAIPGGALLSGDAGALGLREWLVFGGYTAVLAAGAWVVLATTFGGTSRLLMDEATLTVILSRRRWRAGWHEIAEIVAHEVPLLQRDAHNFSRVEIRLATSSGAPVEWVRIPDIFTIGRDELAVRLQRAHAEARLRQDPGQAARFGTAAAAIWARDGALLLLAAAVVLGPLVLLGLILLDRSG